MVLSYSHLFYDLSRRKQLHQIPPPPPPSQPPFMPPFMLPLLPSILSTLLLPLHPQLRSSTTPGQIAIGVTPSAYNPTSGKPSDAAIEESVMLMVGGLEIKKWGQQMEDGFKVEVARATTQYCNTQQIECLTSSARSRQRRSSGMVFYPNMVHILPGYPKQSPEDPIVAMIALYLSLTPKGSQGTVLSKDILTTVIKSNMPSIGKSLDGSIVSVYPISLPPRTFPTNDNLNNSVANRTVIVGAIVGVFLFVVVIAALWMVYKKSKRYRVGLNLASKSSYVNSNIPAVGKSVDPGVEMKECVDGSFANATIEVNPQSNSLRACAVSSTFDESRNSREEICDNS